MSESFEPTRRFITRQVAGETIVVPVCGGVGDLAAIYTLNEVATTIWARVDGCATVAEIAAAVAGEFAVSPAEALADTRAFLEALAAEGMVRQAGRVR